jgi:hypothetical protein
VFSGAVWPEGQLALVDIAEATPVAFINVYEQGDIWMKVQGCEACQQEAPSRCCGKCPFAMNEGCAWHFQKTGIVPAKPLNCVILPLILKKQKVGCNLIYRCVAGKHKGKLRRVQDHAGEFVDG